MKLYYNPNSMIEFYNQQRCTGFLGLKESRISEIEESVRVNYSIMASFTSSLGELMTRCAEKLTTSRKLFDLANGDEALYFFIKTVDPDFLYLEVYEAASKKSDIKPLCLHNFSIYDPFLIYYERLFQRRFKLPELEDLWARGKIDTSLLDKHCITK